MLNWNGRAIRAWERETDISLNEIHTAFDGNIKLDNVYAYIYCTRLAADANTSKDEVYAELDELNVQQLLEQFKECSQASLDAAEALKKKASTQIM
jgi:hypothetical protein